MGDSQGKFFWYELSTTDADGAARFYKDVVGWDTNVFRGAHGAYTQWMNGGVAVGGMTALPEAAAKNGRPPYWMAYVFANDVDALTARAKSLGATVCMEPMDIPNVGRFSVISDPQGAVLALMKPLGPDSDGPAEVPIGCVSWHELMADDQEAAFRFYSELLGWQKTDAVQSPVGLYQMYGRAGRTLGGMMTRPKDLRARSHWLYYVRVADIDGALDRVRSGGGVVEHGPMQVPGGWRVAQCTDPQGAVFALQGL
jgi:predicted enzyme related to lactoylglutathione lyase